MTEGKRCQNLAKCCSVYFQSWMNQWNCSDVNEVAQVLGKTSSNYWVWNAERVWFFLNHCCNHRSKRIEAVRFHHISCGSWTEQHPNPFPQRRHHGHVWSNWRQNLNLNRSFLCSSEKRLLLDVVKNVRIHHPNLLNTKHKAQLFSV